MTIEEIKSRVTVEDAINHFNIEYRAVGNNEYWFIEDGKITDWRRFNTKKNLVTDFSNKNRPQGDVISFVEQYQTTTTKEAIEYIKKNILLINTNKMPVQSQKTIDKSEEIKKIWRDLPLLNDKQKEYLKSRCVDYEKVKGLVKDYNGAIGCIVSDGHKPVWLCARRITDDYKNRFTSLKGSIGNGVYKTRLDPDNKNLIVCEWLFDFLTVRQFYQNVVWLRNSELWLNVVAELSKEYNIILINDNDKAGGKTIEKMKGITGFKLADLGNYKDLNDVMVKEWLDEDFFKTLPIISKEIKKESSQQTTIETPNTDQTQTLKFFSWDDCLKEAVKENAEPKEVVSYWYYFLDKRLGWIFESELILVWWITGTGKTTFSIKLWEQQALQGKKVTIITMEENRVTRARKALLYEINRKRANNNFRTIKMKEYLSRKELPTYEEQKTALNSLQNWNLQYFDNSNWLKIEELEEIFKQWSDLYVLDHLSYFWLGNDNMSKADRVELAMQKIKTLAVKYKTRVVLIQHFKKVDESKRPTMTDFKDSISVPQTADTIILLRRDKSEKNIQTQYETEFIIPKNRIDEPAFTVKATFDISTNDYLKEKTVSYWTKNSDMLQNEELKQSNNYYNSNINF